MRLLVIAAALVALAAPAAHAANAPDTRLDGVASGVGGHAVTVWCEADAVNWMHLVRDVAHETVDASKVRGFNVRDSTTIYLSPDVCLSLRVYLKDGDPKGAFLDRGSSLLALLFESLRQSYPQMGVGHEPDMLCRAVGLVRRYAITLLKVPPRVTVTKTIRGGKRVRRREVPNPLLARITAQAEKSRRASPTPYYMGNACT